MSEIADILAMSDDGWRTRLELGIKDKGLSQRQVSLAAGMAPGYVNSLINEKKDPTIDNLIKVCRASGLSLYFILYGVSRDPDTEEIVRLLEQSSPRRRRAFLEALRDDDQPEEA